MKILFLPGYLSKEAISLSLINWLEQEEEDKILQSPNHQNSFENSNKVASSILSRDVVRTKSFVYGEGPYYNSDHWSRKLNIFYMYFLRIPRAVVMGRRATSPWQRHV